MEQQEERKQQASNTNEENASPPTTLGSSFRARRRAGLSMELTVSTRRDDGDQMDPSIRPANESAITQTSSVENWTAGGGGSGGSGGVAAAGGSGDALFSDQDFSVPLRTGRISASVARKKSRLRGSDKCPEPSKKLNELFFRWLEQSEIQQVLGAYLEKFALNEPVTLVSEGPTARSATSGASGKMMTPNSMDSELFSRMAPMSPVTRLLKEPFFAGAALASPRSQAMSGAFAFFPPFVKDDAEHPPLTARMTLKTDDSVAGGRLKSLKTARSKRNAANIPPFYFKLGTGLPEHQDMEREMIAEFFDAQPETGKEKRVKRSDFPELIVETIGLPSFLSGTLYDRIMRAAGLATPALSPANDQGDGRKPNAPRPHSDTGMPKSVFWDFYESFCASASRSMRLFKFLLNESELQVKRSYLIRSDFAELMQALLEIHPGLTFLNATPEFQQRYAETVVERIFYRLSRFPNGKIYFEEFNRLRMLETLMDLDEEEDINKERNYFSYEHFYVLYCRFWEIDADHDLMLKKDDLVRYANHSLTYRIVDRIFAGYGRQFDTDEEKMSYTDFVWFCLSEEDKSTRTSRLYWFRCIDLDGDGLITLSDIDFFYEEQLHRMECLGHETVPLADIVCQLLDMVRPHFDRPYITMRDILTSPNGGAFFNVLFNLNKFFQQENKTAAQMKYERLTAELSDWDRFAIIEYERLSNDDEEEDEEDDDDEDDIDEVQVGREHPVAE
ncbi:Serine/threonine protein phosphatase 2A regulatory subunit B''beta [Porphyridium purpureum]|uniref:Serine/threonine protein phosphatase 2A regulatory subunit B''beta n=1 Tax=Porphyridium purpureum TaxID=35688 RepID=A0A5J4YWQ2_PORPP|nr:Serine/threonine protein phosphatase 2A regulatory subunit B''beta [Porphyridium purpureum]|eukprot:POR7128..scf209_3